MHLEMQTKSKKKIALSQKKTQLNPKDLPSTKQFAKKIIFFSNKLEFYYL